MASISAASPSSPFHVHEKLDFDSVRALADAINQHVQALLSNAKAWTCLKLKCTSKLKIQREAAVEFSEHSVVSNLYWGIEAVDAAIKAKCAEEGTSRLQNAEKMLQIPASLNEQGLTAGIRNDYLICCSYFYLSVVRKLQRDEWQVAFHFLQALLISPGLVQAEFSPELCQSILHLYIGSRKQESRGRRILESVSVINFDENEVNEVLGWMAREYKAWVIYYQIMSDGEVSQKHSAGRDIAIPGEKSEYMMNQRSRSVKCQKSKGNSFGFEKVHPLDPQENIFDEGPEESRKTNPLEFQISARLTQSCCTETRKGKCLKDILIESDSDTPIFVDSCHSSSGEETFPEGNEKDSKITLKTGKKNSEDQQAEVIDQNLQALCFMPSSEITVCMQQAARNLAQRGDNELIGSVSETFPSSFNDAELSVQRVNETESHVLLNGNRKELITQGRLELQDCQHCDWIESATPQIYQFHQIHGPGSFDSERRMKSISFQNTSYEVQNHPEEPLHVEQVRILEKLISNFCFSDALGNHYEDYTIEISTMYKLLSAKRGLKYSLLKDIILDQLLMAISTSKEERAIRSSVTVLSTIILGNKSAIEDIKRKGLRLYDLVTALRRNVHEASILIYLINPAPEEMKTLEILPCLVEVLSSSNSYKDAMTSLLLTPRAASLMIIEVLVTAFDYTTNNTHLSRISSPRVLSRLLDIPGNNNLEEFVTLAAILVKCMRFDGQCRNYIFQVAPVAPFISLLKGNRKHATATALEYFHELLQMPRSSAINLLHQISKEGGTDSMSALLFLIQNSQPDYGLLAANLLLQLDMLDEESGKFIYQEEAVKALLKSLTCEDNFARQALSAFILANLGGTYSWTGEPYTEAWLVRKAGLNSLHHKNMIKNYVFADESLQDSGIDMWCSKLARRILKFGTPVFHDLKKGLSNKSKRISQDCLTAITWLGCEVAKSSDHLRHNACEILLSTIEQHVHPGFELEERLLACLCIYNYTLGRGMKKLIQFSEGVRESLRRLAHVTWMAEELLKVADYFQPNKWRISCGHTQILEVGHSHNGAVTALIYYKGQLCSGYEDGSIKVWHIKGQTSTLVQDMKSHNKAVTCFSLLEQGNCLLSGSADKTIKIWQMVQRNIECIESITTKESIQSICAHGKLIFAISRGHKMKVVDASRNVKDVFKNKSVKTMRVAQGKVYVGCMDSSIQELIITNNRQQEIRAPAKRWMMQNKPINSLVMYTDWLYAASVVVEGSKIKDWRRNYQPQISITPEKGANVLAMEVVEDFIYLNSTVSRSSIQIWLRGTLQKVGRLSAGSKITSLLTANDMILCGTDAGLIKGWIPL